MNSKRLTIIFLVLILVTSCGNSQTKENTKETTKESIEERDSKVGEAKDCDEFIDRYEKWMDNYIVMIEKYMKNPADATLLNEYMKLAQEGMTWMNQWNSKLFYCASQDKYQERFDEISEKAEKKMKELGIE
ncbi:MAG: hypothetical protein JEY96_06895 [Bacteroidales bacterium]|nr:hypothetical protein [Bacteroidales bacterium]